VTPRIELKSKRGSLVGKRYWDLPALSSQTLACPRSLLASARQVDCEPIVMEWLRTLEPTLENCYHRAYFASGDGRVRVTVDTELTYTRPSTTGHPSVEAYGDSALIVEIKFDAIRADYGNAITSHFRLPLEKNSKYVTGMQLLGGRGCLAPGEFFGITTIPKCRRMKLAAQKRNDVTQLGNDQPLHGQPHRPLGAGQGKDRGILTHARDGAG